MKSQLKTSYLHRQEGKIKPKNYMKKLINQNKVKFIKYISTLIMKSFWKCLLSSQTEGMRYT